MAAVNLRFKIVNVVVVAVKRVIFLEYLSLRTKTIATLILETAAEGKADPPRIRTPETIRIKEKDRRRITAWISTGRVRSTDF